MPFRPQPTATSPRRKSFLSFDGQLENEEDPPPMESPSPDTSILSSQSSQSSMDVKISINNDSSSSLPGVHAAMVKKLRAQDVIRKIARDSFDSVASSQSEESSNSSRSSLDGGGTGESSSKSTIKKLRAHQVMQLIARDSMDNVASSGSNTGSVVSVSGSWDPGSGFLGTSGSSSVADSNASLSATGGKGLRAKEIMRRIARDSTDNISDQSQTLVWEPSSMRSSASSRSTKQRLSASEFNRDPAKYSLDNLTQETDVKGLVRNFADKVVCTDPGPSITLSDFEGGSSSSLLVATIKPFKGSPHSPRRTSSDGDTIPFDLKQEFLNGPDLPKRETSTASSTIGLGDMSDVSPMATSSSLLKDLKREFENGPDLSLSLSRRNSNRQHSKEAPVENKVEVVPDLDVSHEQAKSESFPLFSRLQIAEVSQKLVKDSLTDLNQTETSSHGSAFSSTVSLNDPVTTSKTSTLGRTGSVSISPVTRSPATDASRSLTKLKGILKAESSFSLKNSHESNEFLNECILDSDFPRESRVKWHKSIISEIKIFKKDK
ncbi:hypothetical protein HDU98_010283 [Podochytrium sp. JEL0797]|nr:hypothetical protein HDU98_010283 [Podochytrium sp. JEL0797]